MGFPQNTVVYNESYSSKEEQSKVVLPIIHKFGDKLSVFENGFRMFGIEQHDSVISRDHRIKTRKRCTLASIISSERRIFCCFLSVFDWHFGHSEKILIDDFPGLHIPNYYNSIYEDILMCLQSIKAHCNDTEEKIHLKIVPLGISCVKALLGEITGNYVIPVYQTALHRACSVIDSSWVGTLEFISDISPQLSIPGVCVFQSSRDVLDFTDVYLRPVILAPCDSFCAIGKQGISETIALKSDLEKVMKMEKNFVSWHCSSSRDFIK